MASAGIIQRNRRFIFSVAVVALAAGISGCATTDKTTTGSIARASGATDSLPSGNFDQMNEQQLMQASTGWVRDINPIQRTRRQR